MAEAAWGLWAVIAIALIFDYINGMHDAANAIATVVSTRVLSPRQAILLSACLNFAGAFLSTAVAKTIGKGIVDPAMVTQGLVAAAMLGAIGWNLLTWYYGIPSSSSHALIGGIMGGTVAFHGFGALNWKGLNTIITALLVSPIIGLIGGFAFMALIMWAFRKVHAGFVNRLFKGLQVVSASFMAVSHGSNDAQKVMGVITMALFGMGYIHDFSVPKWVILACASAMALGTAAGGWRIIRTMGVRMIKLAPVNGFAAESAASLIILGASHVGTPVSTTHVISSTILGVGTAKRASAVRWEVAGNMLVAWILTIPASAMTAFLVGKAILMVK
ncbi:MAG TPA: anion permease [Fibrobacteres bacterium]|jgi:PiT family inorganic phosphate transporter|nr:anion permease [Fibrobacterota bacterium]